MTNLTLEEKIQSVINDNGTSGNNAVGSIMGQMPPIPSETTNASPKKSNVVLPARLDFVHVFEPWAFSVNDTPKYSIQFGRSTMRSFRLTRTANRNFRQSSKTFAIPFMMET